MNSNSNPSQIEALLNGDEKTIHLLYNTLFPKVVSYVRKNKGTDRDAEEIFHNALFQLIARAKVSTIDIKSSFEAYIFVICKNLWLKELNKRKKEVRNDGLFELKDNKNDHIEAIIQQERWELFEETMKKLSEKCFTLLKDYFNKVSYDAIVSKFSFASENAAFQKVFKCKKQLADLIKKDPRYKNLRSS